MPEGRMGIWRAFLSCGTRSDAQQKTGEGSQTEGVVMKLISRRTVLLALAFTSALSPAFAASVFSGIDTDNDGTISLDEAKAAASTVFDQLDHDNDGTLDRAELRR